MLLRFLLNGINGFLPKPLSGNYNSSGAEYFPWVFGKSIKARVNLQNDLVGKQGNTGIYSTGVHGHMTVNGTGADFAELFNNANYSSSFYFTDYAQFMTGYKTEDFNNAQLWNNVYQYSTLYPKKLDYDAFFYTNSPTVIK